jgi:hypothetical protein
MSWLLFSNRSIANLLPRVVEFLDCIFQDINFRPSIVCVGRGCLQCSVVRRRISSNSAAYCQNYAAAAAFGGVRNYFCARCCRTCDTNTKHIGQLEILALLRTL